MRLFVGVELDDPVKTAAADLAATLRKKLDRSMPGVRASWVTAENLHITLWFIGEVPEPRVDGITRALQLSPFRQRAFDLSLAGCGVFPDSGPPRVFWIGVARGVSEMAALYGEVGERLGPLGFVPERRGYTAHLTIARIKEAGRGAARTIRESVSEFAADCGISRIGLVTLFRSHLSPKGATYEPLLRVPLS